jgi:hypothetical protein
MDQDFEFCVVSRALEIRVKLNTRSEDHRHRHVHVAPDPEIIIAIGMFAYPEVHLEVSRQHGRRLGA